MNALTSLRSIGFILLIGFSLQSCLADVRTRQLKKSEITSSDEAKGRELLAKAHKAQGLDKLADHKVYSFNGVDHWKGLLGKVGRIWPEALQAGKFQYEVGSFDSQVTFTDGKAEGLSAGLQNWKYYEQEVSSDLEFQKYDKRKVFGLSAYQYFIELVDRLQDVPVVSYAGEKEFNGEMYDLVFATWERAKPHKEFDQYLVYINQKTSLAEYALFTLRDNYLKAPGSRMLYGSAHFDDFKDVDGVKIPHRQSMFTLKPGKTDKKYLHQLIITDFKFDDFEVSELRPNPELSKGGDLKPEKGS